MGVDGNVIDALSNKTELPTQKLNVLQATTISIVQNRGKISDAEINAFTEVGYSQQHMLEIILGVSHKVISNYVNHLAQTPLDEPFKKFA